MSKSGRNSVTGAGNQWYLIALYRAFKNQYWERVRELRYVRAKGCGGAGASSSLALLDDAPTSPASRRLASAHAALGTRHIPILGQRSQGRDRGTGSIPTDA